MDLLIVFISSLVAHRAGAARLHHTVDERTGHLCEPGRSGHYTRTAQPRVLRYPPIGEEIAVPLSTIRAVGAARFEAPPTPQIY